MANYDLGYGLPFAKNKEVGKLFDATIDFSDTSYLSSDTLDFNFVANTYVTDVYYQVVTASTDSSTRTVDIGDTGSATQWVSNLDMKTAGSLTRSSGSAELYTSADVVKITLDHNLTTGKLRVVAYGQAIGS